jgi:hypothetical protein
MAVEPQNLIQVQSSLQDPFTVKNDDLLKYANGSNPEVPAFLALIEMNRRKQIEDSKAAFDNSSKGTIKDQVAGALTTAAPGVNPTQTPTGVNPTASPYATDLTKSPYGQGITQLPTGIDPTQAPAFEPPSSEEPVVKAAEGGLMSLPVSHFNQSSYATGGIVAFGDPALNPDEQQLVSFPQARPASPQVLTNAQTQAALSPPQTAAPAGPPPSPNSYQGILAALPPAPQISSVAPESINRAQAYEGIKESQRLAGVSDRPYEEANKRQAAKEKREEAAYERGGIDRLIAQASAFAKADPARGIGFQAAASADASQVLRKEQEALRDKQETAAIEFHKSIAKEEDAKRRGDAAGIEAAVAEREKAKREFDKLTFEQAKVETDRGALAEKIFSAGNTAKYQEGMLGYHNKMANLAEEQKPSAEDKKLLKVQTTVNAHPVVKAIADAIKQGTIEQGTPEYYAAMKRINEIAKPLYKDAGLEPPTDVEGEPSAAPTKKPSLWDRIFGGSPNAVTSPPSPNAPAAPPPPEVQKILDKYK